jgi:hypothetical protein
MRIEVELRGDSEEEGMDVWDAACGQFHDLPDEESRPEGGKTIVSYEGECSLGGGQTEREAHAIIRSNFGGRAVRTMWWYLEGSPDHEFSDPEEEE